MRSTFDKFILMLLLITSILGIHCGDEDNPVSARSLVGTWTLVSFTDKVESFTVEAGVPTEVEIDGVDGTLTVTGTAVFTETRINSTVTTIFKPTSGIVTIEVTNSISGTYTISGATLTTVDEETGDVETVTFSQSINQLTIENDKAKQIWRR